MIGVAVATDAALNFDAWIVVGAVVAIGVVLFVHNHWLHRKLRQHVTDTAQKS